MSKANFAFFMMLWSCPAFAFTGPVSDLEKYECRFVEHCDEQDACTAVDVKTELIVTTIVRMTPWSPETHNRPNDRIENVETIVWIDAPQYPNKRFPLPLWYKLNFPAKDFDHFRLNDWLSGKQVSQYDEHNFALVNEIDADNPGDLLDEEVRQKDRLKLFEKSRSIANSYQSFEISCSEVQPI